ncbi:MAG: GNAT family N-acetyltransferase [Spirochaetes bacterium]|nr:GNAT family N-acetyltransferase [Spirochaetota bacterium]
MSRLVGERIILRELLESDIPHIHEWTKDPEIIENLSEIFYPPQTEASTINFLNSIIEKKSDNPYFFVIADKKSNSYIGQINFIRINWIHRYGELAIVIGSSELHDKGIGREALKLFLTFSFGKLNLNRIELKVHDYNEIAINCYKSVGFIEEGRLRERFYINNKYTDFIIMGILKDEFMKNK